MTYILFHLGLFYWQQMVGPTIWRCFFFLLNMGTFQPVMLVFRANPPVPALFVFGGRCFVNVSLSFRDIALDKFVGWRSAKCYLYLGSTCCILKICTTINVFFSKGNSVDSANPERESGEHLTVPRCLKALTPSLPYYTIPYSRMFITYNLSIMCPHSKTVRGEENLRNVLLIGLECFFLDAGKLPVSYSFCMVKNDHFIWVHDRHLFLEVQDTGCTWFLL